MYADKTSASCTIASGSCLAATGMDVTQVIFWIVAAAVLIIAGFTLIRMFQAKPAMIENGISTNRKRWSIKKQ